MSAGAAAAPPGTVISNQATLDYRDFSGQRVLVPSNVIEVSAVVARTPANIQFTRVLHGAAGALRERVGPSACLDGGAFVGLDDPQILGGIVIDQTQTHDVAVTAAYNLGEPAFLRLADADQNLHFRNIDFVDVTVSNPASGDSETIRLAETGPDTGVFSGFVPTSGGTAVPGDCLLQVAGNSALLVSYTDPADSTDTTQSSVQFDPVQRVFESRTGTAVSGATIEIVDAASGLPAVVYGNDGVSLFPSSIVSGATATDSSGTSYSFGRGEYRFPVVPDGDYRLTVTPPSGYSAPSVADPGDLQGLPGAPYSLGSGSFGATFTKADGISIALDIPVDPRAEALFLQKRTLTTSAAPGDFLRYELVLENASLSGIATDVRIVDRLPPGLRYVPGSSTVDGGDSPDPEISSDQRTLEFQVGLLGVAEQKTIAYVVELVAGKRDQELVNSATAYAGGGLISNEATAAIRLTEDLFRSSGTIIGRVLEGDCSEALFAEDRGVADVRVYLEDGRYAVSDAGGRFHFEAVAPGTHVAQLDTFTVPGYFEPVGCPDAPGFAGRADSQFVDLPRGGLLRTDFYLKRKPAPEGRIDLELQSSGTDSPDEVVYDMFVNGVGNVPIDGIDVTVQLPDGVHYQSGSMTVDGDHLGDPRVSARNLSLSLPDRAGNWTAHVRFRAGIDASVSGKLSTMAYASFDSPIEKRQRTPVAETIMVREPGIFENANYVLDLRFGVLSAELSQSDMVALDRVILNWRGVDNVRVSATGHTDSQRIAARNRHVFADNYALSRARAVSAAAYVASALGLGAESVQVDGVGPDQPVADNATPVGRSNNRRVELVMSGVRPGRPSFLQVTRSSSGPQAIGTKGAVPGTEQPSRADAGRKNPAQQQEPSIEDLRPGIAMLLPERGYAPAIPAIKVSVQHEPAQSVALWVNDNPVNSVNFDTTAYNVEQTIAVSRWRGVDIGDGTNRVTALVSNPDGSVAKKISRDIYYAGAPSRGEIDPERSVLIADGKTRPVVAVRLYDSAGKPSRRGMVGSFRVAAPYRSWWDVDNDRKNTLVQISSREPTYRVGSGGVALIELEPTTQTGELTLYLKFDGYREQELRTWIRPAPRDWILVGFAEGTAGYNTLSDNAVAAANAGYSDGYFDDGRIAFFAKGQIKGEYLLTMAFDSDRRHSESKDAFRTAVDPNQYYALYADTAEQRFEAPSQRKLYVKLERGQFFALFGDFETGLGVTELSRYQRRFNGLHSEYRGEHVGYTAFAAESDQSFNRDEIRGDGTSGLYRLTSAPIIANSERIRIETRDRFDSGRVLESTTLTRFLDYDLDTQGGTLFFKQPVPSRDLNFNPVFIVAEYESLGTGLEDIIAGGRASLRSSADTVEVGVTHVSDRTSGAEADLTGADFRWRLGNQTLLKAELAATRSTVAGTEARGSAKAVELEHNGEAVNVRAFLREVEDGFGMGYQSAADRGVRRLGVDARIRLSERWYAEGEAGWQQALATKDIRNLARAQLRYDRSAFTAMLGLTHAEDKFDDGESRRSDHAEIGLTQRIFDGHVTLRTSASTALGDEARSIDFPTRFLVGADYRLTDGIDLVAEYEESQSRDVDSSMTRLGVRATPWARAQIDTSLVNEATEFGPRLFANIGLVQGFQVSERWLLDIGLDQSNTMSGSGARQLDPDRELTSGSLHDDFLAVYLGAMYSADFWSANARVEHRNSDTGDRTSLLFGWYRQPASGHSLSAGLTVFRADTGRGSRTAAADFRFGWAHRPADSPWSFLNRLDLVYDELRATGTNQSSWRIINNLNANRRFNADMQLSLQYALKYVRSNFGSARVSGYTDLIGFGLRRGLGRRWDTGASASVYNSYRSSVIDYGYGVDVGYLLATNIRLSLGYNFAGFHDSDFAAARYTAQGPFLKFSIKADQQTLKDIAGQR